MWPQRTEKTWILKLCYKCKCQDPLKNSDGWRCPSNIKGAIAPLPEKWYELKIQMPGSETLCHGWAPGLNFLKGHPVFWENSIETSILSRVKQITSPGWMHETSHALGRPRGMGWGGSWEGGSGWGTHVNPWLIHVSVWQIPLQYCKVISLQLIKINNNNKKTWKQQQQQQRPSYPVKEVILGKSIPRYLDLPLQPYHILRDSLVP